MSHMRVRDIDDEIGMKVLREAVRAMPESETRHGVDGDALAAAIMLSGRPVSEVALGLRAGRRWIESGGALDA